MNKPKELGTVVPKSNGTEPSIGKDIAKSAAGAGGALLVQNAIEKGFGVHNSDIMREIKEICTELRLLKDHLGISDSAKRLNEMKFKPTLSNVNCGK